MSYYPGPVNHIRDKVKVLLDLSNYALKKNNATVVDTSNLAAKRDFFALKAEADKLDINVLVKIPTD